MSRLSRFRACPLCEAICGLELQYEAETLVAIRGDAQDPFSGGHICPKGNAILDLESDPDRIRRPQRRHGDRWEEIGWDEATAYAAERIAAIQREHGASAVAAYVGNPNVHHFGHVAYLPAFLRALKTPNVYSASSVDQWPHQLVCSLMYGHQFLIPIPDVDNTAYFLMLGANPVASMGSLMTAPGITARLKQLTARGKLVVVDPRRTETAQIASEHLFIRPGADALFLIGLLQVLQSLGAPRVDQYAGRINGLSVALDAIAAFDSALIAQRCGVPFATIERIASELAAAPSAAVYGRIGVSTQVFGSLSHWLIQLVNIITGNLDRIGGVLPNEAAIPLTGAGTSSGTRGRWHSRVRGLAEFAGELPVAALAEEIATPGPGQVRALITSAGNPVLSTPNGSALSRSLKQLDFMLSIDIYRNETTRHADLILPPASPLSQYHYDLIFNAFAVRRVARLSPPLRPQQADERADWEIFNALGAAVCSNLGKPFSAPPEPLTLIAAGLARGSSQLTLEDLMAAPHGLDLGPLQPNLLRRLETPSAAIECAPDLMLAELARLREQIAEDAPPGSLTLIGRREIRSNNSWMHNAPRLIKGKPRHHLLMHPDDMQSRAVLDGSTVRLRSRVGESAVEVRASDSMMPGVVSLPHGYGHQVAGVQLTRAQAVIGASYNDLSDPLALDVASGNAALSGLPVWIDAQA